MVDDNLYNAKITSAFLETDPYSSDSLSRNHQYASSRSDIDREFLSETFSEYNNVIGNDSTALYNCSRIRNAGSMAVVTGQQAGMLTGPLYTIYKIITAVNFAKHCEHKFKTPVIPVFWNATEDHDLSEVESFHYPGKKWSATFSQNGVAAQFLNVNPACSNLVYNFLDSISEINHKDEITSILTNEFEKYGEFSSSVTARLFKGTGLVIIEPKLLRKKSTPFFQKCISHCHDIRNGLEQAGVLLQQNKIKPAFQVSGDSTGLFYITDDGIRYQIKNRKNDFFINNKWVSESSALQLIAESSSNFSTGAYLRPVLQSKIIPALAYIAGPAEYRYHLQLKNIFHMFDVKMPVILPRNHATILTKKELKVANKLGLKIHDYFEGPQKFYHQHKLYKKGRDSFKNAEQALIDIAENLAQDIPDLVNENVLNQFKSNLGIQLDKLEKRVAKEVLRREGIDNARIDRFYNCIFPKKSMQERWINIFYFIEQNGLSIISDLLKIIDPLERRHYVVYTDH